MHSLLAKSAAIVQSFRMDSRTNSPADEHPLHKNGREIQERNTQRDIPPEGKKNKQRSPRHKSSPRKRRTVDSQSLTETVLPKFCQSMSDLRQRGKKAYQLKKQTKSKFELWNRTEQNKKGKKGFDKVANSKKVGGPMLYT
ncbi:hypothetical protein CDAR_218801 [Caerostris darwini]|uniref:Uncharacterized protein n=1 Tax=Caerostris darwini TaxID=1538125 RepID=A0AAV4UG76_9ARAC|nr:hypothetical protein CDAR_218801 [Caerostris darwini]